MFIENKEAFTKQKTAKQEQYSIVSQFDKIIFVNLYFIE
jgi:hypothetical protein